MVVPSLPRTATDPIFLRTQADRAIDTFVARHGHESLLDHGSRYVTGGRHDSVSPALAASLCSIATKYFGEEGAKAVTAHLCHTQYFVNSLHMMPLTNPLGIKRTVLPAMAAREAGRGSLVMLASTALAADSRGENLGKLHVPFRVMLRDVPNPHRERERTDLQLEVDVFFPILSGKERDRFVSHANCGSHFSTERLARLAPGYVAAAVMETVLGIGSPELLEKIRCSLPLGASADVVLKATERREIPCFRAFYDALSSRIVQQEMRRQFMRTVGAFINRFDEPGAYVERLSAFNRDAAHAVSLASRLPMVYVLPMDEVVREVLVRALTTDAGCRLGTALSQPGTFQQLATAFMNDPMCWGATDGRGWRSELFVGVTGSGRREDLKLEGHRLRGASMTIDLGSSDLTRGLRDGFLMPTTFMRHWALLMEGLRLVDGSFQAAYHARWKNKLLELPEQLRPQEVDTLGDDIIEFPLGNYGDALNNVDLLTPGALQIDRLRSDLGSRRIAELRAWLSEDANPFK